MIDLYLHNSLPSKRKKGEERHIRQLKFLCYVPLYATYKLSSREQFEASAVSLVSCNKFDGSRWFKWIPLCLVLSSWDSRQLSTLWTPAVDVVDHADRRDMRDKNSREARTKKLNRFSLESSILPLFVFSDISGWARMISRRARTVTKMSAIKAPQVIMMRDSISLIGSPALFSSTRHRVLHSTRLGESHLWSFHKPDPVLNLYRIRKINKQFPN